MAFKAIKNCPPLAQVALATDITVLSCSTDYFYFLSEQSRPKGGQNLLQTATTQLCQVSGPWQPQQQHTATGAAELTTEHIHPQPWTAAAPPVGAHLKGRWVIDPPPSWLTQGEHLTRSPVLCSASQSNHNHLQWMPLSIQPCPYPLWRLLLTPIHQLM